jgi:hypothetical protein
VYIKAPLRCEAGVIIFYCGHECSLGFTPGSTSF